MPRRQWGWIFATATFVFLASSAHGYVDMAPTLGRVVREAQTIAVVEVDRFNGEKGAVILKKVRNLKGEAGDKPIKHQLLRSNESTVDRPILDWAESGRRGVLFVNGKTAMVCLGQGWYQVHPGTDEWWHIGASRPDLPLTYYGTVSRLADGIALMLADKTAIITTLPHGAESEAASFDLALNRASLPGLVKVQRLRANLGMPQMTMAVSMNGGYVVGMGQAGEEEIPALQKKLHSTDATVRAESAADLGSLGTKAIATSADLSKLLNDSTPLVRLSAAAALLRIGLDGPSAREELKKGLSSPDASIRRQAARAAGFAGPTAAELAVQLGSMLKDSDFAVRRAALQAIATIGPAAAKATESVIPLLDQSEMAIDAADALGRIGPSAKSALKPLARLLNSEAAAQRWAAVRAMSQIGGEDAAPAVKFMIRETPKASDMDSYNMMIYFALLGPVAKEAIPSIQNSRLRNPFLRQTTIWAIDPGKNLPWLGMNGMGGGGLAQLIYECYVHELGDHLKPAAQSLAKKIMDGTAGNVPSWGYKLLARFPEDSLTVLTPGLSDKNLVQRQRATVALGYMGSTAIAAKPQIEAALAKATEEKEQRLLKWCLREMR